MTVDTMADLDRILYPKSLSLIGATDREGSFGRVSLEGILKMGFKDIYPVHPTKKELLGLTAYPSVKDIPYPIDLAVSLIPKEGVLQVVRDCAEKHVRGLVLFTAGFGEKSAEGRKEEQEIVRIARAGGTRILGPNTNGIYSPSAHICTFPSALIAGGLPTESGGLSVFGQSGSFNDYLCMSLVAKHIRFNVAVGCGNESDLSSADYLEYFCKDEKTKVIGGYIEGTKDGRRLYELCRDISKKKPIILWKGGLTETGAMAALAHTGSLAGSRQVWEAMFKQTGVVNVNSLEEVADCLLAFCLMPLPRGNRVAIVSGMGGTNIGTADNCIMMGLEMAKFSPETIRRLGEFIPAAGTTIANPLDIGVGAVLSPDLYGKAVQVLADDENIDMILAICGPENPRAVQVLSDAAREMKKPIVLSLFDVMGIIEPQFKMLLANKNMPVYKDPKRASFVLSKLAEYAEFRMKHGT